MKYRLELSDAAIDDIERLPKRLRDRVWERIEALLDDPYPPGHGRLEGGLAGYFKLRVSDRRIIYTVEPEVVFITRVGRRGTIYKDLKRRRDRR